MLRAKLLFLSVKLFFLESIKYLHHRDINKSFINFIEALSKYNIFYIKLFQSIGTNTKLFNTIQREYLLKYLDNVPYDSINIEENIISDIKMIGEVDHNLLVNIDTLEYINSGLIAVVYKTKMSDKDIILKVKKRNIDNLVYSAIDEFELIINLLSKIPKLYFFYLKDIFLQSKKLLLSQLNFNNEIYNIKTFYNNNETTEYVKIPFVYDSFTNQNSNIIVMEYLNGVKFINLESINKIEYSKLITKFSLKSLLFNRIFHADLHAGNIIFMEENKNKKLGIIDFGIVGNISREEQNTCYKFISEIFIHNDYKKATKILIEEITKNIDNKNILNIDNNCYDEIKIILEKQIKHTKDLDLYSCYELNKVLYKYNLKLLECFYKLQYSIGTCYSICINLSGDEPFLNNISDMCKDLLEFTIY